MTSQLSHIGALATRREFVIPAVPAVATKIVAGGAARFAVSEMEDGRERSGAWPTSKSQSKHEFYFSYAGCDY